MSMQEQTFLFHMQISADIQYRVSLKKGNPKFVGTLLNN